MITKLLEDIGTKGDVIVYNAGFERACISDLANRCTYDGLRLSRINSWLVDLMVPFQKGWYQTPSMRGSYSIKDVLPALVPRLSYVNLSVKSGDEASALFTHAFFSGDLSTFQEKRDELIAYCGLDTLGMVEVLGVLKRFDADSGSLRRIDAAVRIS